jgi:hypothetical protein
MLKRRTGKNRLPSIKRRDLGVVVAKGPRVSVVEFFRYCRGHGGKPSVKKGLIVCSIPKKEYGNS